MKRALQVFGFSCLAMVVLTIAPFALADDDTDPRARDLMILTDWFEGEFDNEEQRWFQADPRSSTAEEDRHGRIHTAHARLDLPNFGDHVFYVEEYKDNNPEDVFRQRFVIFSSDEDENAIRMQQGFFKDTEAALGAHLDPGKLSGLTEDDVFFLDECDVYWRRVADQYEGEMKPKSCVFGEGDLRRYSVHNLTLSENKYWRVDASFLTSDDSLHVGHPVDKPHKMRRAKLFECEMVFRAEGQEEKRVTGLRIHDQGGTTTGTNPLDNQDYDLLLRAKEYPYYNTRPDFYYFSFRKAGEARSLAFGVHDPESRRMGLSLGWVVAHCFREGYDFRESLAELD